MSDTDSKKKNNNNINGGSVKRRKISSGVPGRLSSLVTSDKKFDNEVSKILEERAGPVKISRILKAPKLKLSSDGFVIIGDRGYRMALGTHGVSTGKWYCEFCILKPLVSGLEMPPSVRLGWSTDQSDLDTPVGYDCYSYSYQELSGYKFHQSIGQPYGEPYQIGDVIGTLLDIPISTNLNTSENSQSQVIPGSTISFVKNGVFQGIAFSNIFKGVYFPAISLYMGARVSLNTGVDKWKYDIPPELSIGNDMNINPISNLQEVKHKTKTETPSETINTINI